MLVYAAYGLLVVHVGFGLLQSYRSPLLAGLVACGAVVVVGLHTAAARREHGIDGRDLGCASSADVRDPSGARWVDACAVDELVEKRGRVVSVAGERNAVFQYDGFVSAVSNVCQHQNGPLGEGRIVGGCIVCPWHGYEYLPGTGASPAAFHREGPHLLGRRARRPRAGGPATPPSRDRG